MSRKINQSGLELIKNFEGLRLTAYKAIPSEKYYTIGYGHYGITDKNMSITSDQAEQMLKDDLKRYESIVENAENKYGYLFNDNEFSALVSFAYNIGGVVQLTQNGKRSKAEIAEAMILYNKAGGQTLTGLKRRRAAERELFLTPCDTYGEASSDDSITEDTQLRVLVDNIIAGKYGNDAARKNNIYAIIQGLVNKRLSK